MATVTCILLLIIMMMIYQQRNKMAPFAVNLVGCDREIMVC